MRSPQRSCAGRGCEMAAGAGVRGVMGVIGVRGQGPGARLPLWARGGGRAGKVKLSLLGAWGWKGRAG